MPDETALAKLGFEVLHSTGNACVAIDVALMDDLNEIDERKLARLLRIMELWCSGQSLTTEQYNGNEGRAKRGDLNVMLQAFKTHKVRLFGIVMRIDSKRSFLIVDLDPAKKQNKADPKILKRAHGRALDLTEKAGEKK